MENTIYNYFTIFCLSMVPVIELRGAIPIGIALNLSAVATWLTSVAGNMLPVPFIILCIRSVFSWMEHRGGVLHRIVRHMKQKADKGAEMFYRYELLGLCILVAIPLPGTGAWTGALVAAMLRLRMKDAIPAIFLGGCIAGIIVLSISCGVEFAISI